MSIDEKINEALGISNEKPATKAVVKKEFTPPVPRMEDKEKEDVDNDDNNEETDENRNNWRWNRGLWNSISSI